MQLSYRINATLLQGTSQEVCVVLGRMARCQVMRTWPWDVGSVEAGEGLWSGAKRQPGVQRTPGNSVEGSEGAGDGWWWSHVTTADSALTGTAYSPLLTTAKQTNTACCSVSIRPAPPNRLHEVMFTDYLSHNDKYSAQSASHVDSRLPWIKKMAKISTRTSPWGRQYLWTKSTFHFKQKCQNWTKISIRPNSEQQHHVSSPIFRTKPFYLLTSSSGFFPFKNLKSLCNSISTFYQHHNWTEKTPGEELRNMKGWNIQYQKISATP